MSSRRSFLRNSTFGLTAAALAPISTKKDGVFPQKESKPDLLSVGIAGYTFHHLDIDQSIVIMQQVGVSALSIKDFHLPLNSSQSTIDEVKRRFNSAGISIYAAGVIYMRNETEADQAFSYAKKLGVDLIIGSPAYDLLPYAEKKVREENIRIAIHNHGPEDKLYPGPKDIYDRINKMDSRMGICLDIGHALRAGADPARSVSDFSSRIFDLHIKDLADNSSSDKAVPLGRGIIDIPSLVKALQQIQFKGRCSIEFEQEVKDPLPGIAESTGFFRGVMSALS